MTHADRNTELCKLYTEDWTIPALATRYAISRLRVRQILRAAGVWKRSAHRPAFLGVDVTEETKDKLKELADQKQTSMSRLAADAIETMLEGAAEGANSEEDAR